MDKKFDVIVVGAGNGGLAAAATIAKNGLKTLLLEKQNLPGGSATSFCRGRFEFEPSLHELASVGTKEKPDIVYNIFDGLGAKPDWRYEHNTFRAIVKGENGYDVKLSAGIEAFCDSMEKAVPGCREGVHALFDLVKKDNDALAYITEMKGKPNGLTMMFRHGDFMRVASHSVEDVMKALKIPEKARDILCTYWGYLGVPTDELNCMHYLSMMNAYVVDGAAMPYKRSHELSLSLEKVLTDNGGEVWYNSPVTEFLYGDDGAVVGVVANGEKLYAKEVISNVIPNNVYNMSEQDKVPAEALKLANAREFGISVETVYLGLDCTKEELGINDYTVFVMKYANARKQYDERKNGSLYIVNCLNEVIPDSSPKGTCTMFFTIPIFGEDLPDDLTPEQYKKYKNKIAKEFIEDYEKLMHMDIMSHIEEISVATPVTFARYLGTPAGTIYGYKLSDWDNILGRISCEKDEFNIKGLTFCGGHGTRGDGYSSSYINGQGAAKKVVKRLKGGN
jgi:prolycopene isomerase